MSVMTRFLRQCRRPSGLFGRIVARGMNVGHIPVTLWGLGHLPGDPCKAVLDVGCGGGATMRRLAGYHASPLVCGIDLSDDSARVSRRRNAGLVEEGRGLVARANVTALPFADGAFDLVTAVETHYFWPDLEHDLKEVLRVLAPGGRLMIAGEDYKGSKFEARNIRWVKAAGMRHLTPGELRQACVGAGFADVQMFVDEDRGWVCAVGTRAVQDAEGGGERPATS